MSRIICSSFWLLQIILFLSLTLVQSTTLDSILNVSYYSSCSFHLIRFQETILKGSNLLTTQLIESSMGHRGGVIQEVKSNSSNQSIIDLSQKFERYFMLWSTPRLLMTPPCDLRVIIDLPLTKNLFEPESLISHNMQNNKGTITVLLHTTSPQSIRETLDLNSKFLHGGENPMVFFIFYNLLATNQSQLYLFCNPCLSDFTTERNLEPVVPTPEFGSHVTQILSRLKSDLGGTQVKILSHRHKKGFLPGRNGVPSDICSQSPRTALFSFLTCTPSFLLVEVMGQAGNFTPVYFSFADMKMVDEYDSHEPTILTPMVSYEYTPYETFYPRPQSQYFLLYCDKKKRGDGSVLDLDLGLGLSILPRPADQGTWFLTILSYSLAAPFTLRLGILGSRFTRWVTGGLYIIGTLSRQSILLELVRNQGLHLILGFVAIVFSSGYEAFISSHVIAPTPPPVFQSLTQFLDHNYRIYLRSSLDPNMPGRPSPEKLIQLYGRDYVSAFNQTNNLGRFNQSFDLGSPKDLAIMLLVKDSRLIGVPYPSYGHPLMKVNLKIISPRSICHSLWGQLMSAHAEIWKFENQHAGDFRELVQKLDQGGLGLHYEKVQRWAERMALYNRGRRRLRKEEEAKVKDGLALAGSQILTMLGLYGICLGGGGMVFIGEVIFHMIAVFTVGWPARFNWDFLVYFV